VDASASKDILTFIVTVNSQMGIRIDLENEFIIKRVPEVLRRAKQFADYFYFVRQPYEFRDSIWLRFKVNPDNADDLRKAVGDYLKLLESERLIEKVWDPQMESDQEVFGSAPGFGPTSAYGSLWCFLDATSRTALNLLTLSGAGTLDVPEWVIADIWVHFFYNAMGIPDFVGCSACGGEQSLRLPRCHACGFELPIEAKKPNRLES
jgi:hypothetical protein